MGDIRRINLSMPYGLGAVNCYLVEVGDGFVLIDTGPPKSRSELEAHMTSAGCKPAAGNLKLIVLTHGDFDHTGNAAHLRETFGAPIAMQRDDSAMAEKGDMFSNRSSGNPVMRVLTPLLFRFSKSNRFSPDRFVEDGDDLTEFGFDAQVLSLPGHSKGSVGILTGGGDLFCGDLLENTDQPAINSIMDDPAAGKASLGKLQRSEVHIIYPGHGEPFALEELLQQPAMEG